MNNKLQFIECDGLQIAVSIETNNTEEHPVYYPSNIIFYIVQGEMHIKYEDESYIVSSNSYALIRKYTSGTCFKAWGKDENGAIVYAFVLKDKFIQAAIKEMETDIPEKPLAKNIFVLANNEILDGLFNGIINHISNNEHIDTKLLTAKTKAAILGILRHDPEYIAIFSQFAKPEKAELMEFMDHNYVYNVSLKRLAEMSGRSLSTFNREFKKIYNDSPHRWILKRRLHKARELLINTSKKASDIYLEIGFEDLAHFSRSFKKEFGKTPTETKKLQF